MAFIFPEMRQTIFLSLRHFIFPNLWLLYIKPAVYCQCLFHFSDHQPWQKSPERCFVPGDRDLRISVIRPRRVCLLYRSAVICQGRAACAVAGCYVTGFFMAQVDLGISASPLEGCFLILVFIYILQCFRIKPFCHNECPSME